MYIKLDNNKAGVYCIKFLIFLLFFLQSLSDEILNIKQKLSQTKSSCTLYNKPNPKSNTL